MTINHSELSKLLQLFSQSTNLPITILDHDSIMEKFSLVDQDFNLPLLLYSSLPAELPNAWYICTPEYMYFAGVHIPESAITICIGPVLLTDCTNRQALAIVNRLGRKAKDMGAIQTYFETIQPHSMVSFHAAIHLICLSLDVHYPDELPLIEFNWDLPYKVKDYREEELVEDTNDYDLEQRLLSAISHGDMLAINKLYREDILPINVGNSKDLMPIRNFISIANMLASRVTIQNGVDYKRANRIQNRYYTEIFKAETRAELSECFLSLIKEYTKLNAELSELPSDSLLVKKITQYTQMHITEKLSTSVFADALGMNAAYLSTHFKKETGKTISTYVQEEKVREAKLLLDSSHLSLIEISNMLEFSSESYFCAVFKKITGMTPESYRH